jgi:hypothetical protein
MPSKNELLKKKLELLKKTTEIDATVERGDIEEQAMSNSSVDLHPAEEYHTYDLLDGALMDEKKQAASERKQSRPAKSAIKHPTAEIKKPLPAKRAKQRKAIKKAKAKRKY